MCREIRTPDQEVTERRSVAVDFSGLSGALALFVEVRGMKTRALGGPAAGPSDDTAGFLARFKKAQGEPTRPEGGRAAPVGGSAGPLRLRQGDRKVTVGGLPVAMAFLHTGPCPEPEVVRDGNVERVAVGRRTIAFDGERIVLGAR
jgi:hypothetical protein